MALMRCPDCGAVFPQEDVTVSVKRIYHNYLDDCPEERFYAWLCPECGADCLEEYVFEEEEEV